MQRRTTLVFDMPILVNIWRTFCSQNHKAYFYKTQNILGTQESCIIEQSAKLLSKRRYIICSDNILTNLSMAFPEPLGHLQPALWLRGFNIVQMKKGFFFVEPTQVK